MRTNFLLPILLGMFSFFFEAPVSFHMSEKKAYIYTSNNAAPQVTTTATLSDVGDAYVRNGSYAALNNGASGTLAVRTTTTADGARATYLKFPLSSVSGTITSAVLRIYGRCTDAGVTTQVAAYGVSDDSWTESGLTWNNAPAASGAALSTLSINNTSQYYEFNVTAFVQAELSGDKTASFVIQQPSNLNHFLSFTSKESTSKNRPQLVITTGTASTNQAPVLASIGNKTVVAGQTLNFTATATDADAGQTLSYSLTTAPSGAAIGASSGAFSWTPATAGSYPVTVRVTDNGSPAMYDDEQITITVSPANHAPVLGNIGNQTVVAGQLLTFTATATDADAGQSLTYSLPVAPSGAAIDQATGAFSWTPASAGTYSVTVRVTDNGATPLYDEKQITVTVTPANQPPVLAAISDATVTIGQTLTFTASATDDASQTLTYSLTTAPSDATINSTTGAFSWTPATAGTYPVAVQVSDNGSPVLTDQKQCTITVVSNQAPVLKAINDTAINVSQALTLTASATDPDAGQTLTYSLTSDAPSGATIDPVTGVFTWTPAAAGTYPVTVVASDNGASSLSDQKQFTITVTVNQTPVLDHIPLEQYATADQAFTFTATASDPDAGQRLTYSLPLAPSGATIDPVTGVFSWTPDTPNDYQVTVRVTDNGTPAKYDEEQIVIVVSDPNQSPVLDSIANQSVTIGQPLSFTATASDPDAGQIENFYLIDAPDGATIDPSSGVFTWTPDSTGIFIFTVHVSDNGEPALTDEQQVTITVSAVNQAPVLALIGNKTATVGQALTFTAKADDIDSTQTKAYSLFKAPDGAVINTQTGAFTWTPTTTGNFTFSVIVMDNGTPALSDSEQITVTVNNNATTTATLSDVGDAYVRNGSYAALNNGASGTLAVRTTTTADGARATYLKFPLSSVSGTITSAVLRIYGRCTDAGVTTQVAAYGVSDDSWTESGLTWNNAPAASGAALSTLSINNTSQYYEFNVTAFVQAELSGDKTASFVIQQPSNLNHFLSFTSKESTSKNRPQLVITTGTASTNQAPVLASIGNKTVVAGQTLNFTATATDADAGQTLSYSLTTAPSGAAIGASSGAFSWTPATAGSYPVTVRVTDNGSPAMYDDEQITITVSPVLTTTTFSNTQSITVPNPGTVPIPITVSGLPNQIDTATYGLQSLTVKITHPSDKELTLQLKSPDGKVIYLFRKSPGVNINTTFDAVATKFIDNNEIATYTGSFTSNYRPRQDLSLLNNGQNPNGTWYLMVKDDTAASAAGTVTGVSLIFGNNPAKPLFSTTTLPIVKLYTANGADIINDSKIVATMYIINNGGATNNVNQTNYQYQGTVGIAIRGNTSATHATIPKKQYSVETRMADGVTNLDTTLFGMAKENDWILSAVMTDKSLMRNVLTYQIARDMGWWASHTQYCEVMINDEYRGVFTFEEKIKRDKNRVNIKDLGKSDITAPKVTGGYIFSVDDINPGAVTWQTKFTPKFQPFQFVFPKSEDLQPAQKAYLQSYVDSFEAALHGDNFQDPVNGFRRFAVDNSFIDYFLVSEVSKNKDGYRASTYFYKDRGGKIVAQPVWDYDRAWDNDGTCNINKDTGYAYRDMNVCQTAVIPWWWARLLQDSKYNQDMICRYNSLRQTTLSLPHLYHIIDSSAAVLNAGPQQRNFIRWNIWGKYVESIPKPYTTSFGVEIDTLKHWIAGRLAWLDNAFGTCPNATTIIKARNADVAVTENSIGTVYPSPFSNHLSVSLNVIKAQSATIRLVDMNGKQVYQKVMALQKGPQVLQLDLAKQLANGLYLLQVNGTTIQLTKKVFRQE